MNRVVYVAYGTIMLLFAGMIYAWSVLSVPIAEEYANWGAARLALTFTICMISFCIGGFVNGVFGQKIKLAVVILFTATLYVVGLNLTAHITDSIWNLYIGFGFCCGFATGIIYNTIISTVVGWFPDKPGVISGTLLMGFGFGSFLVGKMYQALLDLQMFGWREIFSLASLLLVILYSIGAVVLRRVDIQGQMGDCISSSNRHEFTSLEMLQTKTFWIYLVWLVCTTAASYILVAHASGILKETAPTLSASSVATFVGFISIFNGFGRVFFGALYDKLHYKKTLLLIEILFSCCVSFLLVALWWGNCFFTVTGFICGGLFFAGVAAVTSVLINDFFGVQYYAANYSLINMSVLVSSFGSTLAGLIYDAVASYIGVVLLLVVAWGISVVCAVCVKRP